MMGKGRAFIQFAFGPNVTTNFLQSLASGGNDPGITLMKGNTSTFSGWQKVVNSNGTIQYVNCN